MPITYRIEMLYECDNCLIQGIYNQADVKRTTIKALHATAKKNGWVKNGSRCWCKDCFAKMEPYPTSI